MNNPHSESQNAGLIHPWQVYSMRCQGIKRGDFLYVYVYVKMNNKSHNALLYESCPSFKITH